MPDPVHHQKADDIVVGSGGQTEGMVRSNAIVEVSDKVCASGASLPVLSRSSAVGTDISAIVMTAEPHSGSAVHHHGEQDTIVYAVKGYGSLVSEGGKKRQNLKPGDFALIPAFAEHQEVNDGEEPLLWIITRSGSKPIVQNLDGWGKS